MTTTTKTTETKKKQTVMIQLLLLLTLFCQSLKAEGRSRHDIEKNENGIVTLCPDEELYCPVVAERGHCLGDIWGEDGALVHRDSALAVLTLSKCRQSCIRFFEERPRLLEEDGIAGFLELAGGLRDDWRDMLGYRHQLCSFENEMTHVGRVNLLMSHVVAHFTLHNDLVPKYTDTGVKKLKCPDELFQMLRTFWAESQDKWIRETECQPGIHHCHEYLTNIPGECTVRNLTGAMQTNMIHRDLEIDTEAHIRPLLERWSGVSLKLSKIYGFRRYQRGSFMKLHVDRNDSHVISAIINIAQDVDSPWPLDVLDWKGNHQKITMQPGEMIVYESAKMPHGRVEGLKGKFYDNLFVHFKPTTVS